jgi:MFS family permease
LQGVFGAILAPAALSLLTTTFTEPDERAKAFAVYGAVQGMGGAVGLLLGGVLTEYLSWRWCLFINGPISIAVILAARGTIVEIRIDADRNLDVVGAILTVLGLACLVDGFTLAADEGGLLAPMSLSPIIGGLVLVVLFVYRQRSADFPLLPLRVVTERNRAAAFLSLALVGAGMFGMLLFLSFYLQNVQALTPLQTGLAFLPFSIGIIIGSAIASKALPRLGEGCVMAIGLVAASRCSRSCSRSKARSPRSSPSSSSSPRAWRSRSATPLVAFAA